MQLIATILLASAYICLQLPAIDYLYRIEKVYNYLLHFLAYRDIVYMLLVVFRCASLLLWPPPGVFGCRGCFYIFERDILPPYSLLGEKVRINLSALRSITKEGLSCPSLIAFCSAVPCAAIVIERCRSSAPYRVFCYEKIGGDLPRSVFDFIDV